jgi:hypothetical protein
MIRFRSVLATSTWLLLAPLASAAVYYVSPNGRNDASGSADSPLTSLAAAAEHAQPGDIIRVASGLYRQEQTIELKANGTAERPIRIEGAEGAAPHFDFSAQQFEKKQHGIHVQGNYWHLVGLEVTGTARFGINVSGHHNIVERCRAHENQSTGIQLSAPASYNLILDCDSYRNFDRPTRGENADGFGAKFQIGPGNVIRGCRSWENADDGFDLWRAPHPVRIENCLAYRNGLNLWGIDGFTGNGNGFKVGGDFVTAAHTIIGCTAIDQPKRGFDQNNNTAGLVIEHCTAIHCLIGFSFTLATKDGHPHVLRDNVGWDAPAVVVEGTVLERNHWANSMRPSVEATFVPSTPVTKASAEK